MASEIFAHSHFKLTAREGGNFPLSRDYHNSTSKIVGRPIHANRDHLISTQFARMVGLQISNIAVGYRSNEKSSALI